MRRRNTVCLVKLLIATFIAITVGLMISSWVISPETSNNISNQFNGHLEKWQQNDEDNRKPIPRLALPDFSDTKEDEKHNAIVHHPKINKKLKPNFDIDENSLEKIDWHDKIAMADDRLRTGLGERGKLAKLPEYEAKKEQEIFDQNGFNGYLSDKISLNRSLPDIRYKGCQKKKYLSHLPTVSIIIPFYNEHWSTLLRSVYSTLNRSPPELLVEIILVDDYSDKEFLGKKLDDYVAKHLPKVKILRLKERSGLIVARIAGAKLATAQVLIFLDSHIEANYNWLPPLLEPIALNSKACVCPFIDVIDHSTFEYRAQDEGARGAFDWQFYYKRLELLPEDLKDLTKPFRSPIMAGGLFAIGAEFFWDLGGYDEGLDIWGGEQYELSFKIWMCGGEMVDAPCSRVGHIYRGRMISRNPRKTDYLHKNYKRVAEVWMDEYAQYLYARDPQRYKNLDAGDLTKQKAIRERLQCKSFKWFMENIAFDLPKKYPPVEPPDFAFGIIRSHVSPTLCLDTLSSGRGEEVGLYPCSENPKYPQSNQNWALSWHKDLRIRNKVDCLDVSKGGKNAPVVIYDCHGMQGNQLWFYEKKSKWLMHGKNMRCLEAAPKVRKVYVNDCRESNANMKWDFGFLNETALGSYVRDDNDDL